MISKTILLGQAIGTIVSVPLVLLVSFAIHVARQVWDAIAQTWYRLPMALPTTETERMDRATQRRAEAHRQDKERRDARTEILRALQDPEVAAGMVGAIVEDPELMGMLTQHQPGLPGAQREDKP